MAQVTTLLRKPEVLPSLTERQAKGLRFIYNYALKNRCYPLLKEIAAELGISTQSGSAWLAPLVTKGFLKRTEAGVRNIEITELGLEKLTIVGTELVTQSDLPLAAA